MRVLDQARLTTCGVMQHSAFFLVSVGDLCSVLHKRVFGLGYTHNLCGYEGFLGSHNLSSVGRWSSSHCP